MFFMFKSVMIFLLSTLLSPQLRSNGLHDIIMKYQDSYTTTQLIKQVEIESAFLGTEGATKSFSKLIDERPASVLEVDENGFLPIDLLILQIKKTGDQGLIRSNNGERSKPNTVGKALIAALVKLSQAMIQEHKNLHTNGIKIIEVGQSTQEHTLSPLGFLLSPFGVQGYKPAKDRTLQGDIQCPQGLLPLADLAFEELWKLPEIQSSIVWKDVTCVENLNLQKVPIVRSTPLHVAVRSENLGLMEAILSDKNDDRRVDVNALDGNSSTPLTSAFNVFEGLDCISEPNEEVIARLLECPGIQLNDFCKADDSAMSSKTPLERARYYIEKLIEKKEKVRKQLPVSISSQSMSSQLTSSKSTSSKSTSSKSALQQAFSNTWVQATVVTCIVVGLAYIAAVKLRETKEGIKEGQDGLQTTADVVKELSRLQGTEN